MYDEPVPNATYQRPRRFKARFRPHALVKNEIWYFEGKVLQIAGIGPYL